MVKKTSILIIILIYSSQTFYGDTPLKDILKISQEVDAFLLKHVQSKGESANPVSKDSVFVKRAAVSIAGRIATHDEVKTYLASKSSTKRTELIESLFKTPGYALKMTTFWANLLRIKSKDKGNKGGEAGTLYLNWVRDAMINNMPYDVFVKAMISASGHLWSKEGGPLGYYFRDKGMPLDNMANSMRIFTGTNISCAQCHDHPFDKWSQLDFYKISAFTGGMTYSNKDLIPTEGIRKARKGKIPDDKNIRRLVKVLRWTLSDGIFGDGVGKVRLPFDYKYKNGKPGEYVKAKVPFGHPVVLDYKKMNSTQIKKNNAYSNKKNQKNQNAIFAPENNSRTAFANWLTSTQNPRFAQNYVNRMWREVFGLGLVEPVDQFKDDTKAVSPELLEFLSQSFIDLKFNQKDFLRVLHHTEAFARQSISEDILNPTEVVFKGPIARRMAAEELWDSVLLVSDNKFNKVPEKKNLLQSSLFDNFTKVSLDERVDLVKTFVQKLENGESFKNILKEEGITMEKSFSGSSDSTRILARMEKRLADIKAMKKPMRRLVLKKKQLEEEIAKLKNSSSNNNSTTLRSGYLNTPTSPSHAIRVFGASNREGINSGHTNANIQQALLMMNQASEQRMHNKNIPLWKNFKQYNEPKDQINSIYMSLLNRKANGTEIQSFITETKGFNEKEFSSAVHDLIWVLMNSNEFYFVL